MLREIIIEFIEELVDFSSAVTAVGIPEDTTFQNRDIDFVIIWLDLDDNAVAGDICVVFTMLDAVDENFAEQDFDVVFEFLTAFYGRGKKEVMHPVKHVVRFVDVRVDLGEESILCGGGIFTNGDQEEVV